MSGARALGTAVALIVAVVCPQLLDCSTTRQIAGDNDHVGGGCPVTLTPVRTLDPHGMYTESVTVTVWIKASDLKKTMIEITSMYKGTFRSKIKNGKVSIKKYGSGRVWCVGHLTQQPHNNGSISMVKLVHDCESADVGDVITVIYNATSMSCSKSYTIQDPVPDVSVTVNRSLKTINVTVQPGDTIYTRLCYENLGLCSTINSTVLIDSSQSRSVQLETPNLLPCVCVEVYYTHKDARRNKTCPFKNESLADVTEVWRFSSEKLYETSFRWSSKCPLHHLKISGSLCWRHQQHLCTPVINSTLEAKKKGTQLIFDTSAVDRHPQMCVQLSLQGSHKIYCRFTADMSYWDVNLELGSRSLLLNLTWRPPLVRANFSAQLCVLHEWGCSSVGQVYSATTDGNTTKIKINVPVLILAEKPCVQVWQSDPALSGRRILCPDYTHYRWGVCAVAALVFVFVFVSLGVFIHHLTKRGAAGWLCIQKPVLLVCSSDESAHVSAVCALASMLQGELSATVHMSLWAHTSQSPTGPGTAVADLGPLPWLYGQWEAVREAQGKVLIVWSPYAKKTYEKWREERGIVGKSERKKEENGKGGVRHEKIKVEVGELNGGRLTKCKKEKKLRKTGQSCEDKDFSQREPSTVIAPVFTAALSRLEGELQGGKGQGVALVYFQGLSQSRDIPKSLRGLPRYCLPQDFRGLIQELGGMRRQTENGKFRWHCWPRLLSKALTIWLARQLAKRLRTHLPQTQGKSMQKPGVATSSSSSSSSSQTQDGLKLPPAADTTGPGTEQEQEPLCGSPWRPERL